MQWLEMLLKIDQTMGVWLQQYGLLVYGILFLIVFAETAFVVVPFLPGDSLLFMAGAFGATGAMNPWLIGVLLIIAAVSGNTVNYRIGHYFGPKIFDMHVPYLDKKALKLTHDFYERHGGKTIIMARFVPVVRTFAPFVAGIAQMTQSRFQLFNITGALLWVVGLVGAGYFFGNIPFVRQHLNTIVILGLLAALVPVLAGVGYKMFKRLSGRA